MAGKTQPENYTQSFGGLAERLVMKKVVVIVCRSVKRNAGKIAASGLVLVSTVAQAQSNVVADAQDMLDGATTIFGGVKTFVVAAVTFFIVIKVVKWIRK